MDRLVLQSPYFPPSTYPYSAGTPATRSTADFASNTCRIDVGTALEGGEQPPCRFNLNIESRDMGLPLPYYTKEEKVGDKPRIRAKSEQLRSHDTRDDFSLRIEVIIIPLSIRLLT